MLSRIAVLLVLMVIVQGKGMLVGWGPGIDWMKSVFMTSSHWSQWNKFIRGYVNKAIDSLIKEDDAGIGSTIF